MTKRVNPILPAEARDRDAVYVIWHELNKRYGFNQEHIAEMMELIVLQGERIRELEEEVERLGGATEKAIRELRVSKPLDREIKPNYINERSE